jgi:hypothetical protein
MFSWCFFVFSYFSKFWFFFVDIYKHMINWLRFIQKLCNKNFKYPPIRSLDIMLTLTTTWHRFMQPGLRERTNCFKSWRVKQLTGNSTKCVESIEAKAPNSMSQSTFVINFGVLVNNNWLSHGLSIKSLFSALASDIFRFHF